MRINRLAISVFVLIVLLSAPLNLSASVDVTRISGSNRYETAVEISKAGWEKSSTVILTRGDNFPDALAGTPLAHHYGAPILLTTPNQLPASTRNELDRLEPTNIVLLGGISAISEAIENDLIQSGYNVSRISGKNRYETAALIAAQLPPSDTAVIVYGSNFPDALAVGPYAAINGYPILLSTTSSIPSSTLATLEQFQNTIVVGGTNAISESVYNLLPNPIRISGSTRYHTAVEVIRYFDIPSEVGYIATGVSFADALTGSALAAKLNAPLLLVRPTSIPLVTSEMIRDMGITRIVILGGENAVIDGLDYKYHEVTDIILSAENLSLMEGGGKANLSAVVEPSNATNNQIVWSSSNDAVAFISNGVVTADSPGTTLITATSQDNGMTKSCLVTVAYSQEWDDGHGNSLNNQEDGNKVFLYEGWLYYYDYLVEEIYYKSDICRVRDDGTGRTVLLDKEIDYNLQVYKGWLYFIGNDKNMYKMITDGSRLVKLELNGDTFSTNDQGRYNMVIYKDKIYYQILKGLTSPVYETDLNGTYSTEVSGLPSRNRGFIVRNNSIYYINYYDFFIYKYSLVTQKTTQITSIESTSMNIEDGWLYFLSTKDNYNLYRVSLVLEDQTLNGLMDTLDTGYQQPEKIVAEKVSNYRVHDGWIYYTRSSRDGGGLYKISVTGENYQVFDDSLYGGLTICGNHLYLNTYPYIYRFDFNGNNLGKLF